MGEALGKKVIEIDELCECLGIGKNTAYSLLVNGEIDAFKIGTVWKIPVKHVDAYIDRMCSQNKVSMCKITK